MKLRLPTKLPEWRDAETVRRAWYELNAIRARDGGPRDYTGGKVGITEEWFSAVVDDCAALVERLTGKPLMPWPLPSPLKGVK
jgi:hypothetical protein